jgi:hypothetical protein
MKHQAAIDLEMASKETVWTLFTKPSYRKRMICAFFTMFGAESTGILVIYSECLLDQACFLTLVDADRLPRLQRTSVPRSGLHRKPAVDPGGSLCFSGLRGQLH